MAVFLFFGNDTWSLNEKLNFWRKEFEKKHGGDMNISIIEDTNTSAQDIFQMCTALPFLAEKRLVIVKDFLKTKKSDDENANDDEKDKNEKTLLAPLLDRIPDFCVLVFKEVGAPDRRLTLFKKIQKIGTLTEFQPFTGSKLLGWIEKMVTKRGGTIDREAIIFLSEFFSGDLYRLENEICKLTAYANGRQITKKDIELLVDTQFETSIFKLTDAVGQRNRVTALKTLHHLIDSGDELFGILHMIMRQFRIITSIKDLSDQGLSRDAITAKLHEHPFVISNTLGQTRNFSMEQLRRAYELLIDMDTKLKSGGIKVLAGDNREFVLALDRLVVQLCK